MLPIHPLLPKVRYRRNFLSGTESKSLLEEITSEPLASRFTRDKFMGHPSPRTVLAVGDPGLSYKYAGNKRDCLPWTPLLSDCRDRLKEELGCDFTFVLINCYRDGKEHIGWHSDNERDMKKGSTVASVSLGAARDFQLRESKAPEGGRRSAGKPFEVSLENGSLLTMEGDTQENYQHCLPKRRRVHGERHNLTFRCIVSSV